ncbi:MAG: 3-oxoacyl-[acyl-carrier-protein] synthase III C-terminal domain-containing protein [Candidatus Obscuribacterales bacterium]|nr:3-oxoacyl-[acyl-carrier-protein] synthase III C-terminal domain-containing protein [Candidatus Obscuribacterales bacterium]
MISISNLKRSRLSVGINPFSHAAATKLKAPVYPVSIVATGSYKPSNIVPSSEIDKKLGYNTGYTERLTGVRSRPIVLNESTVEMAAAAARHALKKVNMQANELDCIIYAGAVTYQAIPISAVFVQRALGLQFDSVPCFDVNTTCLSFLAAFDMACALMLAGRYKCILVCSADSPSLGLDWKNPEAAAIFGDGAGAAILRPSENQTGVMSILFETYSEGADACQMKALGTNLNPHNDLEKFLAGTVFEMNGSKAYEIASKKMPGFFQRLLESAQLSLGDIDLIIPHQASAYALKRMTRRLGLPADKVVDIFSTHGNQVSASLPTALDAAYSSGKITAGQTILLLGTGAGITLGGAVVRV